MAMMIHRALHMEHMITTRDSVKAIIAKSIKWSTWLGVLLSPYREVIRSITKDASTEMLVYGVNQGDRMYYY